MLSCDLIVQALIVQLAMHFLFEAIDLVIDDQLGQAAFDASPVRDILIVFAIDMSNRFVENG